MAYVYKLQPSTTYTFLSASSAGGNSSAMTLGGEFGSLSVLLVPTAGYPSTGTIAFQGALKNDTSTALSYASLTGVNRTSSNTHAHTYTVASTANALFDLPVSNLQAVRLVQTNGSTIGMSAYGVASAMPTQDSPSLVSISTLPAVGVTAPSTGLPVTSTSVVVVSNSTAAIGSVTSTSVALAASTAAIGTVTSTSVTVTSLPALAAGTAIVGAVKDAGPNWTPVRYFNAFTTQCTSVALWTVSTGKKFWLTDLVISNGTTPASITLLDGAATIRAYYFAANGGVVENMKVAEPSSAIDSNLSVTSTGDVPFSIVAKGYETT